MSPPGITRDNATLQDIPGHDEHRGGGADPERDALRNLIEVHPHRDALRQPYPLKGRADAGQQVVAGAAVALGDAPADAIDLALQGLVGIGHQGDDGRVAGAHVADQALAEVAVHPIARCVNQRQRRLVGDRLAAEAQVEVGDIAVHRGAHLRELQVQLRRLQRGLGGT